MSAWYDEVEGGTRFIKIPEGKSVTLKVAKIYKKTDARFQPTKKDGTKQGWSIEIETDDGRILTVSSYALQRELINLKVDNGDTIEIYRGKTKGDYRVTKVDISPF